VTLFNCPFRIQRLTLQAGIQTPITPPITCSSVTVANRTLGDLRVETDPTGINYGIITSCFEDRFDLSQSGSATALYHDSAVVFFLRADQTGEVILTWT